jgi:hypothetical protein
VTIAPVFQQLFHSEKVTQDKKTTVNEPVAYNSLKPIIMENFLNLVKKRYSVRDFSPDQVVDQKLQYILECGRLAPSAANYQPWHVIVVRDPEVKKKLVSTYSRSWFAKAPIILVICGNHQQAWTRSDGKHRICCP